MVIKIPAVAETMSRYFFCHNSAVIEELHGIIKPRQAIKTVLKEFIGISNFFFAKQVQLFQLFKSMFH